MNWELFDSSWRTTRYPVALVALSVQVKVTLVVVKFWNWRLVTAAGVVSGTTPTTPAAVTNLQFQNLTTTSVTLTWTDNATNATGYRVIRQLESNNSQFITTLSPTATTYTDTGLTPGRAYDYTISAINLAGPSAGADVSIQTVPTAPTGLTATVGSKQVTLNWTSSDH